MSLCLLSYILNISAEFFVVFNVVMSTVVYEPLCIALSLCVSLIPRNNITSSSDILKVPITKLLSELLHQFLLPLAMFKNTKSMTALPLFCICL